MALLSLDAPMPPPPLLPTGSNIFTFCFAGVPSPIMMARTALRPPGPPPRPPPSSSSGFDRAKLSRSISPMVCCEWELSRLSPPPPPYDEA